MPRVSKSRVSKIAVVFGLALLAAGCGQNRLDRTVTGAGIGAGTGALAGVLLGPIGVATGALVGGGAGAGVGYATNPSQINLGEPVYR